MAQLESETNLTRLTDPRMRLLVETLIRTGLRIGDATRLRIDCLVRDPQGAAYLHYRNHKIHRDAMVPIDERLATAVGEQQQRVRARHPRATDTRRLIGQAETEGRDRMVQMNRTVEANLLTIITALQPGRTCSCGPSGCTEHCNRDAR